MDSLVGYGSDDDNETERYQSHHTSGSTGVPGGSRRRDDDTNYDEVNMDLSEDSQAESEPELPQAEPPPSKHDVREDKRGSSDSRERDRDRERERDRGRDDRRRRESPPRPPRDRGRGDRRSPRRDDKYTSRERDRDRDLERDRGRDDRRRRESPPRPPRDRGRGDRRSPRRDDKYTRSDRERSRGHEGGSSRRGLLGDRPDDRTSDKVPALMDLKPFAGEAPPPSYKSQDHRDAVSPRFVDRGDRRDRERDRERERDRDRHSRRSAEKRPGSGRHDEGRSRSRGAAYPPPPPPAHAPSSSSNERRSPPSGEYRPSSYKVNKKLEVMEKMGLQIKTPDGSMATAQQLRAAAGDAPPASSGMSFFNPGASATTKIMDQVQKRKLLWSNKNKSEAEEAAKWSGTRFAQDSDGRQVSKFMRLMGIKDQAAIKPDNPDKAVDPIKKQEELFQAMQAQYEVARATTHTMRGVGLGFQRSNQL